VTSLSDSGYNVQLIADDAATGSSRICSKSVFTKKGKSLFHSSRQHSCRSVEMLGMRQLYKPSATPRLAKIYVT